MLVNAFNKNNVTQITLPDKVKGQYWLTLNNKKPDSQISIEGIENSWILKSNHDFNIYNINNKPLKRQKLSLNKMVLVKDANGDETYIYSEKITKDRKIFDKYVFKNNIELSIGRASNNDICFNNKTVSGSHALLTYNDGRWTIKDTGSLNGTFVNGDRVSVKQLNFGDLVLIMGLKIVLGKNFIAINNPDGNVVVSNKLSKFIPQPLDLSNDEDEDEYTIENRYFFRSPRFKRDIETLQVKIDAPPDSPIANEMPMVLVLGTSMTMGMMSMVTLANAVITNNYMSMAMGGSMLLGTVLVPVITKKYERNRNYHKEQIRQKKYQEYLDSISVKIEEASQLQKEILEENIVSTSECEKRILDTDRKLWDRSSDQNDFLNLRVGVGSSLLDCKLTYPEKKFEIESDNLKDELYMLCEYDKEIPNVPISFSLFDNSISGVIGEKSRVYELAKGLIIQIASLYSYDETKIVCFYDEEDKEELEFVKWLPHAWTNDNKFRFIGSSNVETREISNKIETIYENLIQQNTSTTSKSKSPYFVVFSFSKNLMQKSGLLSDTFTGTENQHMSIINFETTLHELPKECSMIIELKNGEGRLYNKNDISGKSTSFTPDLKLTYDPLFLCKKLSNIYLESVSDNNKLPSMLTFMNMFDVGKVEHLNVRTRWEENDPTKSLGAPVGVDTIGDKFILDLHEKFHGPHGLIAGMTGSGKSEFIISYILSLAINYHPNEVAFVLIDYKGGGMAKSFEKLPHTVGIITNLDGAAINRSLVSIESELRRRQSIFAEASKKIKVSNIDIYRYQKLYRDGIVDEPLPHLFIISDEFAELKTQRPEFMKQLVSAARIGRSLGVHLILATQKPSGVVDDQIWSNSRFRVCLKVQERADSMDMLKRPDAAELSDTGRFYLQVGYNELFEIGQSSWSGAPYIPSETVHVDKDESIQVIDNNANIIKETINDTKSGREANANKQVDVITKYLRDTADEDGIKPRLLWLEPIPGVILVDDVAEKYSATSTQYKLNPVIGEYDDPAHQEQCLLRLPLTDEGNVVVYGSVGSGKTSFLNAMTYSLIKEHTPEEVNVYLLDFGAETLRAFQNAPHVGDVVLAADKEKIDNLFKKLLKECKTRKKLFADYGGDYKSYVSNSSEPCPAIVVAINNLAAFSENYEEKDEIIYYLTREGVKYGIYFVVTVSSLSGIRMRLAQNFNQSFVLQLNDVSDYASVVGRTEGLYPSKYKGRGLVKLDALYEFQVASLVKEGVPFEFITQYSNEASKNWEGQGAPEIAILPEAVNVDFAKEHYKMFTKDIIPVGVETESLNMNMYPFGNNCINIILSNGEESSLFNNELTNLILNNYKIDLKIFDAPQTFSLSKKTDSHYNSMKSCIDEVNKLFDIAVERHNTYKDAQSKGKEIKPFDKLYVIINSVFALKNILPTEEKNKVSLILEKCKKEHNILFIINEQIGNISSFSYDTWYKTCVSSFDGIWVGSGFVEQFQIKANNITREMRNPIPGNFGYTVTKGKCKKTKLLSNIEEE